jgi:glutamyl-tRNA reductase
MWVNHQNCGKRVSRFAAGRTLLRGASRPQRIIIIIRGELTNPGGRLNTPDKAGEVGRVSVLVVGLSHKSAPVALLERAAVSGDTLAKLLVDLAHADSVAETFVISTCNRVEVYADIDRFHAGVTAICELIARHSGIPAAELTPHLYVHYKDRDVVICCTGTAGQVITADMVPARRRDALVFLDLAMPRDVEPGVAGLPGVAVISLDTLARQATMAGDDDVAAVHAIMEAELAAYQSAVDAARVAPTVVALRAKAAGVVDAELARLAGRLGADGLSGRALDETAYTVRRVVDKLLHAPTVRVKELAGSPRGEEYAAALRVLFDLDPRAVDAD